MSWLIPVMRRFLRPVARSQKRILAVYDFRVMPFTVGDILLFCHAMSLLLRELHKVDKIDIALVCDSNGPARDDGGLDSLSFHYHFSKLLPMAFVNPHLGALLILDSREMLENYIADNHQRYYIFPPYRDAQGRYLNGYEGYFNYIQQVYAERGYLPKLSCHPSMVMWARKFLAERVRPRFPVTIQLRNTSTAVERNARLECWLDLIAFCQSQYDVTFVLIGETGEIDARFREFPNVLVAKDFGTTVEQDMALIQATMFFMGSTCGPSAMAMFSDLPYVLYNFRTIHEKMESGKPVPWATPLQKLVWHPETTEQLIADFTWLYEQIDRTRWGPEFDRLATEATAKLLRRRGFDGILIQGLATGQR